MARTPLEQKYPWLKTSACPDTVIPHRVPFAMARRFHQICAAINAGLFIGSELTLMNYMALACLDDFPGVDQRRLARMLGVDPTNAGLIVDELETKGLAERRINGAIGARGSFTLLGAGKQCVEVFGLNSWPRKLAFWPANSEGKATLHRPARPYHRDERNGCPARRRPPPAAQKKCGPLRRKSSSRSTSLRRGAVGATLILVRSRR